MQQFKSYRGNGENLSNDAKNNPATALAASNKRITTLIRPTLNP